MTVNFVAFTVRGKKKVQFWDAEEDVGIRRRFTAGHFEAGKNTHTRLIYDF